MGEFASNAKANTGVALGAVGTGLAAAQLLGGCNGLGNVANAIFGGCNQQGAALNALAQKDAEIAMLKAENYSDKVGKEVYEQHRRDMKEQNAEVMSFIKPLAEEAANNRVKIAQLEAEIKCCCEKQELREQIMAGKINEVALATNGRINTMEAGFNGQLSTMSATTNGNFDALNATIACLTNRVNSITSEYVPACKVTPIPMPLANGHITPAAGTTFYPGCVSVGSAPSSAAAA